MHGEDSVIHGTLKVRPYYCGNCKAQFESAGHLRQHVCPSGRRTCPQCQRYTTAFTHVFSRVCQLCETGIEHAYGPDAPPVTISPRQQVLDMAKKAVLQDRNNTHGDPEDNFAAIAALWKAWKKHRKVNRGDGHDVAVRMLLMKAVRMGQGELNPDDYADAAGYASCAYEAAVKHSKRMQEF